MRTEDREVWPATVVDGLNRIQSCIETLDYEAGRMKYAEVTEPINEELQRLFLNIRIMKGRLEAWRAAAPCKIWAHDGFLHCTIHKAHWPEKGYDGVSDCPNRKPTPEAPPLPGSAAFGWAGEEM